MYKSASEQYETKRNMGSINLTLSHIGGKRRIIVLILLILMFIHSALYLWTTLLDPTYCSSLANTQKYAQKQKILDCLGNGTWIPRDDITTKDKENLQEFLYIARNHHNISMNQRADNKCGNISASEKSNFRALCNPDGPTPCCHSNQCVAKVPEKCTCDDCFDIRQKQHAEFSTWRLKNSKCHIKKYRHNDACKLLNDLKIGQISIIGDSLQRNLYSVMMMMLSEDGESAVTATHLPQEIKERCAGMKHFSDHACNTIYLRSSGLVCNNTVLLNYNCAHKASLITLTFWQIFKMWWTSSYDSKSLVVLSMGLHEDFNHEHVNSYYIQPINNFLNLLSASYWSEVLWVTPHVPGLLKSPKFKNQQKDSLLKYTASTNKILKASGIPVLNTLNLTEPVFSWDGTHYGQGLNKMLLDIVLNYLDKINY